ncbi:peptidase [Neisseria sp. HMSC073G10]|uniref:PepSY domain-containing protein n=1 Tax=Neisseria sp. HMSC073G10 TaxID=1739369 RepID=UPI0008A6581E|nr:PepSY domain-containing protein [Neisseria sp. HMSC073G10]OFR81095.1 peptidase [Neisseria sp. HMSC073G10]
MKLRSTFVLLTSVVLVSGSLSATAAHKHHSRSISKAQAITIAKKHVGGGRVTDVDRSNGRWEIEIRKGCTEYDVDVSIPNGRVTKVDQDNHCDD